MTLKDCTATGMPFKRIKTSFIIGLLCLGLNLAISRNAIAEDALSPDLKSVIQSLDKDVSFRDDALVTFSNKAQYVLISPARENPALETPGPIGIVRRIPANSTIPDIIELSDGHFLLRIITLPGGRKTFPLIEDIPIEMRTGLLPQYFHFPEGFLLPTAWKSLTGNLLVMPETPVQQIKKSYPLAIWSPNDKTVYLWNTAQNRISQYFKPGCTPAGITVSDDAQTVFIGCAFQPKLIAYAIPEQSSVSYKLQSPASAVAFDTQRNRLFVSHAKLAQITAIDLTKDKIHIIETDRAVVQMALSPFRNQLYALLAPPSFEKPPAEPSKHSRINAFFFHPDELHPPAPRIEVTPKSNIAVINLKTANIQKVLPVPAEVGSLYVQDEKLLWMAGLGLKKDHSSPEGPHLLAFDLRWQEFSPQIPLSEIPVAMGSDSQWLYLLGAQSNTIARYNLKSQTWGDPILLEPKAIPSDMVVDFKSHQAYVLSANAPGVQVINLDRGQWIGTEKTDFQGIGTMAWLIPTEEMAEQQVRVKFQNGRVLLQNAQAPQSAASPSDPHGPPKTHTPPGHLTRLKKTLSRQAKPPGNTPDTHPQSQ